MASQHLFKSLFLLAITLISIGLLTVCLVSDWWIQVDRARLQAVEQQYQAEYVRFKSTAEDAQVGQVGNFNQEVSQFVPPSPTLDSSDLHQWDDVPDVVYTTTTAPTVTTTTTTTTKGTTTTSEYGDYGMYDYNGYDDPFAEKDNQKKKIKRRRGAHKVVDYVYVMRMWPLVKFKSLYAECIEYKELPLKVSAAYLLQSKKEPVTGAINYGPHLNSMLKQGRASNAADQICDQGEIQCVLSQECVRGAFCDGVIDCNDQSDEQQCQAQAECKSGEHKCDNRCVRGWHKCDQTPHCTDLSDERGCSAPEDSSMYSFFARMLAAVDNSTSGRPEAESLDLTRSPAAHEPFALGQYHYNEEHNCFMHYFDFKSARLVQKEHLQYLSQSLADHLQEANNISFHVHLIYALSFAAAFLFFALALFSLLFVVCFKKLCFQCPFWFYGFFNILAWLSASFGLLTFLYEFMASKQRTLDPLARLPIDNELLRLNTELADLQTFGLTFWFAVAATSMAFFSSFVSCIICCRLPTARHEDKEYKIMQLPTYS